MPGPGVGERVRHLRDKCSGGVPSGVVLQPCSPPPPYCNQAVLKHKSDHSGAKAQSCPGACLGLGIESDSWEWPKDPAVLPVSSLHSLLPVHAMPRLSHASTLATWSLGLEHPSPTSVFSYLF